MNIDYAYIASAVYRYKELGYEFIEVPWIVSQKSHESTASPPDGAFVIEDRGYLIGSAEQGFIEIIDKLEPNKKYASVSPCFRKNDNKDQYHQETFMKVELFTYHKDGNVDGDKTYFNLIHDAGNVFSHLGIDINDMFLTKESENAITNVDIILQYNKVDKLELGSYGYRNLDNGIVINYGTGLALPRFTQALHLHYTDVKSRMNKIKSQLNLNYI